MEIKKTLSEYHLTECMSADAPATKTPPQAIQGMWQAYGQMRSARTRGRFGIAATGIVGLGLFAYKIILNDERKDLKLKESELEKQKNEFNAYIAKKEEQLNFEESVVASTEHTAAENVKRYEKLVQTFTAVNYELEQARAYIKKICDGDKECISKYHETVNFDQNGFDSGITNITLVTSKV